MLTLCKAACPNFAFRVYDFNAARTEAEVETDDHVECAQCGEGFHCVRAAGGPPLRVRPREGVAQRHPLHLTLLLSPRLLQITFRVAVEWLGKK